MDDWVYAPGSGFLYRLDPRAKLIFVIAVGGYLALESASHLLLLVLAILHILGLLSKGTRSRLLPLWKTMWPLLITIILLGSLRWRAEDALWGVGPITVTRGSIWTAVGLGARIAGLSLVLSLLLWTTDPGDAVAGLTRLGVPFELGFPMVMALEYVVTYKRTFYQILEAQQSRGLTLSRGNPVRMARAYIPVLVPLLITALRSVDSLALALQSRGFASGRKRTSRRVLRLRRGDWVFLAVTACALAGLAQV
ncbi:MAG: energy-coupling factor transporter transmembrane protein EcfT [Anaerolineae bacterium]|nr:energy-coupling factor transporter transmembrane protein EcfT [Anaerolineae bacterium]